MANSLPPGFVVDDSPAPAAGGLPPGFVVDNDPLMAMGLKQRGPTIQALAEKNANEMSPVRRAIYGGERALDEVAMGVKQIFPKALGGGLSSQEENDLKVRRATEKALPHTWESRLAGDLAMAIPVTKAATAVSQIPRLASRVTPWVAAAGAGAVSGALQPVVDEESRGTNTVAGGVFGAGGKFIGDTVGRGIEGIVKKNPTIAGLPQAIRDRMTLGQTADRNTFSGRLASNTEEKLQSVPGVGEIIRGARQKSTQAWRDDLTQRVAPNGHVPAGDNTWEKLNDIAGAYRGRYVAALGDNQVPPSQLFESQVAKITNNPRSGLREDQQAEVRKMAMDYYKSMFHGNSPPTGPAGTAAVLQGGQRGTPISIDAANAKDFESFLTKQAMQYRKSNAPGADNMAQMFEDLERAWSVSYRRALPSSARKGIKELDSTYAPFKTVERAAAYTGNDFGDFTPQQLVQAVRSRTPQSKFARGGGILQDEAATARNTLIDRVPNSGTADRAMTVGALGGAAYIDPMTTAATLGVAVPAMVTKTGRNLATGDTKLQAILQRLRANSMARGLGPAGGLVGQDFLTNETSE